MFPRAAPCMWTPSSHFATNTRGARTCADANHSVRPRRLFSSGAYHKQVGRRTMKAWAWRCALAALLAVAWMAFGQGRGRPGEDPQTDVQLPNGKSQRAEILKAEREQ